MQGARYHFCAESGLPAKAEACVGPGRAYCRQASQEALNTLSFASLAPPPASGVLPITCCIFLVLYTIPLRTELTAKAFLLSTAQLGIAVLQSQAPRQSRGACVSPEWAYCQQASQEALKKTPPASLALRPVNGRRLSKIIFLAIVKLFISSRFARCWKRKPFYSPQLCWGLSFR